MSWEAVPLDHCSFNLGRQRKGSLRKVSRRQSANGYVRFSSFLALFIRTRLCFGCFREVGLTFAHTKAIINLKSDAPRLDESLEKSMHKTFTDCYFAPGFTGGGWNYAMDSNDAEGNHIIAGADGIGSIDDSQRRLAYYCIGWETTEVSDYTGIYKFPYLKH